MPARLRFTHLAAAALLAIALGACGITGGNDEQVSTTPAAESDNTTPSDEGEGEPDDEVGIDEDDLDVLEIEEDEGEDNGDTDAVEGSFWGGDDDNNSGSRPTPDEIAAAFEDEAGVELPAELVSCVGEGLYDSDLPNGVLRALVEGREAEVDEDNVDDYENTVETIAADCVDPTI